MGLLQPGFVRWAPPASQNLFNYWAKSWIRNELHRQGFRYPLPHDAVRATSQYNAVSQWTGLVSLAHINIAIMSAT